MCKWDCEERVGCQECIYWSNRIPCQRRIDHSLVKVHYPSFATCYDNQLGRWTPCSDFKPNPRCKYIYEHWVDFDTYVEGYKTTWGEHGRMFYDGLIWIHLGGHLYDIYNAPEYAIETKELVFGKPFNFKTGELHTVKKRYCKKYKKSNFHPLGFEILYEDIESINVFDEIKKIEGFANEY